MNIKLLSKIYKDYISTFGVSNHINSLGLWNGFILGVYSSWDTSTILQLVVLETEKLLRLEGKTKGKNTFRIGLEIISFPGGW